MLRALICKLMWVIRILYKALILARMHCLQALSFTGVFVVGVVVVIVVVVVVVVIVAVVVVVET